jgi:hypothetical protein
MAPNDAELTKMVCALRIGLLTTSLNVILPLSLVTHVYYIVLFRVAHV